MRRARHDGLSTFATAADADLDEHAAGDVAPEGRVAELDRLLVDLFRQIGDVEPMREAPGLPSEHGRRFRKQVVGGCDSLGAVEIDVGQAS